METIVGIHNESVYNEILQQAVAVIETARGNAARAIVSTSNEMYWRIGQLLYERKLDSKHGDNVVRRLSADLKSSYPRMGMSVRNLFNMKRFYVRFHKADPKVQQAVALLPWGHISYLMSRFDNDDAAIEYYASKCQEKGWSRDFLVNAVKLEMHKHQPEDNM